MVTYFDGCGSGFVKVRALHSPVDKRGNNCGKPQDSP